jgi:hypothetical protein
MAWAASYLIEKEVEAGCREGGLVDWRCGDCGGIRSSGTRCIPDYFVPAYINFTGPVEI